MKALISNKLIEQEIAKRKATAVAFDVHSFMFEAQLRFKLDPRPFKTAVCSRRAGKTIECAADLIDTASKHKDVICLYITLSRKNAKKLIWKELKKINRSYKLNMRFDNTELSATLPNGSIIYVSGAKDATEIEKFRGLPIKLCYIDECQSFRAYLETLIDDIIAPALIDYAGSLCLIGTPGPVPAGYFYKCSTQNDKWSHHSWTFYDNPHIPEKNGMSHKEVLDRELERKGVSMDDPSIQREWFGKWVMDSESLLLKYQPELNHYETLPPAKYVYVLGIDVGFVDADALAVIAWSETEPTTYLIEELITEKQGLTELVQQIQAMQKKYNIAKMLIDEGGLGKKLAEEMRRRHHIPVHPAEKQRKMENVAFLNDALRTGKFKAKRDSCFAQDSYKVEIDKEKSTPDKIRVKDNFHSDIIDAVLYAFKESPAYAYQAPKPIIKPKSPEYYANEVSEMEKAAEEYFQAQEDATKGWGYE
jgi:Phage terminase large subunit/Terminase RNaseH-like domain